jgi:hypothetical protein
MILELTQIGAGALLLCSPLWGAWMLTRWIDNRPTAAERWERNHRNIEARREQINRRGW